MIPLFSYLTAYPTGEYSDMAYHPGIANPTLLKITGNVTASLEFIIVADATDGAITVTLPKASDQIAKVFVIKKIDASVNAVTIDGDGTETIDGAATLALLNQFDAVTIASDGTEWWKISKVSTA